jgi:hypothetical protein
VWDETGVKCRYNLPSDGKVNNFQAVQWLSEACKTFHYDIVVTSTWRLKDSYKECLINGGLREGIEILGRTIHLTNEEDGPIFLGRRGREIQRYLDEHPEINYFMIIDDDEDVPINEVQREHFIQTVDSHGGFNKEDFFKFVEIANRDLAQGGSFPDRKYKDYRRNI